QQTQQFLGFIEKIDESKLRAELTLLTPNQRRTLLRLDESQDMQSILDAHAMRQAARSRYSFFAIAKNVFQGWRTHPEQPEELANSRNSWTRTANKNHDDALGDK